MKKKLKNKQTEKEEAAPEPKREGLSPMLIWARDIIVLVAFVFAFRAVVAEANYIPTRSMLPTLQQGDKIIVDKISLRFGDLNRGDIVIFYPPNNSRHVRFIKRVIGLPGETVEVRAGVGVFIDSKLLDEPYIATQPNYYFGPKEVPQGSYFLLGDNRCESEDSHVWGMCPDENVIGRALFRYWPVVRIGSIENKSFREHYFFDKGY
jgi:signal peptidase I